MQHRGAKPVDNKQPHKDHLDEQGRPLSLSLPFTPGNLVWRGAVVRNLLPDSEGIRRRLAMRYQAIRPAMSAGREIDGDRR